MNQLHHDKHQSVRLPDWELRKAMPVQTSSKVSNNLAGHEYLASQMTPVTLVEDCSLLSAKPPPNFTQPRENLDVIQENAMPETCSLNFGQEPVLSAATNEMVDDDLAVCSPTALGFSLNEKIWNEIHTRDSVTVTRLTRTAGLGEFAVEEKKKVIKSRRAVSARQMEKASMMSFPGKGQGVIILFGPPGVGETLTAEAITERLERPLYSICFYHLKWFLTVNHFQISSVDLSARAEEMEVQLTRTFCIASDWKAVLLLDEADVYLQQRDGLQLERLMQY
ncbi:hypothetical protein PABG_02545 [Paracoccidioides brasiliensis Pb03]|nr:hypothetical protein PABG_02545 [Paracoccidioides brasiliensis Pb03]